RDRSDGTIAAAARVRCATMHIMMARLRRRSRDHRRGEQRRHYRDFPFLAHFVVSFVRKGNARERDLLREWTGFPQERPSAESWTPSWPNESRGRRGGTKKRRSAAADGTPRLRLRFGKSGAGEGIRTLDPNLGKGAEQSRLALTRFAPTCRNPHKS